MVKKELRSYFPYVAIVGLVGIVAIVVLVLNRGSFTDSVSTDSVGIVDEEGNLVGEAFRYQGYQGKYRVQQYRVQLNQSIAKAQTYDDLNYQLECAKVVGEFAVPRFDNGQDLCTDNGYDSCTSAMIVDVYEVPNGGFQQVALPADCDSDILTLLNRLNTFERIIDPPQGRSFNSGQSLHATCCRIS